jgi:methyl-accepting chemotaxis protein
MFKSKSLNFKFVFGFLVVGAIPALIISILSFQNNSKALIEGAEKNLIAIRESKAFQLEELYITMGNQVSALAQNNISKAAILEFQDAFNEFPYEDRVDLSKNKLADFYKNQFGTKYEKENLGKKFTRLDSMLQKITGKQIVLQDAFISSNTNALGEKDNLYKLDTESSYSEAHAKYHDTFRTYLKKFDYYDIFLISASSNEIIYSVYKEIDYATNLVNGPFANSGIAEVFNKAKNAKDKNDIFVSDMDEYYPSYDYPAQFIASPIFQNSNVIGVLVFQVPVPKINAILTSKENWKEQGHGESGETYIIDKNKRMKSISRFLVEDSEGFFEVMKNVDLPQENIDYMKSKNTSALALIINSIGAGKVTSGETGFDIFPDYRNVNVLSAYRPLKIKGVDWFILSEMDEEEALKSVLELRNLMILIVLAALSIVLVFSLFLSKKLSNTLAKLSYDLTDGAKKVLEVATITSSNAGKLSTSTEQQAASIQETSASINQISAMVSKSTDHANDAFNISTQSKQNAEQGMNSVGKVVDSINDINQNNTELMNSIDENNREIEEIVAIIMEISDKTKVINDIVFQTKLLSFNASVEAARAGEHGKGFSVVAEEVGALAQMSGKASSEIASLLDTSISKVESIVAQSKQKIDTIIKSGELKVNEGVDKSKDCTSVLSQIYDSSENVNRAVQEIASSATEQSTGVREIMLAIQELEAVTQKNSDLANNSSLNADELKAQSYLLTDVVTQMQNLLFGIRSQNNQKEGQGTAESDNKV